MTAVGKGTACVTTQVLGELAYVLAKKFLLPTTSVQAVIAGARMTGSAILYSEDMQHDQVSDGALTIRSPFVPAARQPRGAYRVKARRARTSR